MAPGFFDELLVAWQREPVPDPESEATLRRPLAGHPHASLWIDVGRLLPLEQSVEAAAALTEGSGWDGPPAVPAAAPVADSATPGPSKPRSPLTPREQEVAVLIARGAANRHIAARLTIAERTAMRHVEHILNKLGVHSRAEVAAWAAQQRLLDQRNT